MPYKKKTTYRKKATVRRAPARKKTKKATAVRLSNNMGTRKPLAFNTTTVQRGYSPFGNRYVAKLPFCTDLTLQTVVASGYPTIHKFRLNSLFDPDLSGTGHQPRWFDQLKLMYESYRVTGVKVSVNFNDPGEDGLYVGINAYNVDQTAYNSVAGKYLNDIRERRIATVYPLNNTGKQNKTLNVYLPIHSILGMTKLQYQASSLTGSTISTNPSEEAILEIFSMAPFISTGIGCSVSVKLTYYCTFYDYQSPDQS